MKYVTGIYALNMTPPENTPGDWHFSALNWGRATILESADSPFGDWGIYYTEVPAHGPMYAANHLRACLDLIGMGNYGTPQGMREYFIADDTYNRELFTMIARLRESDAWSNIDRFMGCEYGMQWINFKNKEFCNEP